MDNNFYNSDVQQNNNGIYNQDMGMNNMNSMGGMGGMNNMNSMGGMNNMQYPQNQDTPDFTKYLILSIIQLLCCCTPTGIIALIFLIFANSSFKCGNYNDYTLKIKTTKTSLTIGWVIGIVLAIVNIIRLIAMFFK